MQRENLSGMVTLGGVGGGQGMYRPEESTLFSLPWSYGSSAIADHYTARTQVTKTNPEACYQDALKAANRGQISDAIAHLSQAIRLRSNYLKAYQYRAFLHEKLGHVHQAASDFKKVAELRFDQIKESTATRPPETEPSASESQPSGTNPSKPEAATPEPQTSTPPEWSCIQTITGLQGYLRSLRSNGSTTSLAFHPQHPWLASGGADGIVLLWDLTSRDRPRRFEGHQDKVTAIAFSPDGQVMVTGSWDKTLRVWDVGSGGVIATLTSHEDAVSSLSFLTKGEQLISSSWDGTLRIWTTAIPKKG